MTEPRAVTVMLNPTIDRLIEVPRLVPGEHVTSRLRARYPAGKATNVSRALAILGCANTATGLIGREEVALYESFLRRQHGDAIDCRYVAVDGQTRESITLIDPEHDTHIRGEGFTVTADDVMRQRHVLGELIEPGTVVCICGSLPPGLNTTMLIELLDFVEACGGRVAFDSNGAHMPAIAQRGVAIAKPNALELRQMAGRDGSLHALASALIDRFDALLVSDGANGAGIMTKGDAIWGGLPLKASEVSNTVGCGDSLLAGFIAGTLHDMSNEQALRQAIACAAANAMAGMTAGFSAEDVERLLPRVTIDTWA
jgi:1-phosphofructokinase family hexose kinase